MPAPHLRAQPHSTPCEQIGLAVVAPAHEHHVDDLEAGTLPGYGVEDRAQALDLCAPSTDQLVDDDGAVAVQTQRTGPKLGGLIEGDDDGASLGFVVAAALLEGA